MANNEKSLNYLLKKLIDGVGSHMSDDQIVEAVEQWVKKHPNPGTKVLLVGRKKYSPNDIVKHMKKGDKIGKQFKKDIVQLSTDLLLGK